MLNEITPGTNVAIDSDDWDKIGLVGKVVEVNGFKATVLTEGGVTMTVSLNQLTPQTFLSE